MGLHSTYGGEEGFGGKTEGKRPPWEDNVKMDLQEVE